MREIEIKVRVGDIKGLRAVLESQSVILSEPITQRDQVFGVEGIDGGGDNSSPWMRIRTETTNGQVKQIFTLKRSITNQLDSIEHETEVSDEIELANIIRQLGFVPYSDLTKTRQKALLGEIEVCVDSVSGLGDFIEVEKLTDENADYAAVAAELWVILESFGLARADEVTDGYDVLMERLRHA